MTKRLGVLSKALALDLVNWQVRSYPHLPIRTKRLNLTSKTLQYRVHHTIQPVSPIRYRKHLPTINCKESDPKIAQESSEHIGPSLHKMKGFCKRLRQTFHPNLARNLGRHILANFLGIPLLIPIQTRL